MAEVDGWDELDYPFLFALRKTGVVQHQMDDRPRAACTVGYLSSLTGVGGKLRFLSSTPFQHLTEHNFMYEH